VVDEGTGAASVKLYRLHVEVKGLREEFNLVLAVNEVSHPLIPREGRAPSLTEFRFETPSLCGA
jgi:hypothetical protein